ncbi:MAG: aminotransferase class III-fold pyridoxal phosphate-dependent enzyme [Armatimonadota bacterium]
MRSEEYPFQPVSLSLQDIAGEAYIEAVCEARARLSGDNARELQALAGRRVDLYPSEQHARMLALLPMVGHAFTPVVAGLAAGATTQAFAAATHGGMAPVNGSGPYRVGEDGRLYLITKSEHYHAPLGHAFPGYGLIDIARCLGIPNATHNNTRGQLTRLLEMALVGAVHGITGDTLEFTAIRDANRLDCANRVLNLETGSLATEAALKMMLARFYRTQDTSPTPPYQGRTPVMLVMGNEDGGMHANYHGTTMLTQMLRGMWPELAGEFAQHRLFHVHPLRPNRLEDVEEAFARFEQPPYKIAGFFHEIVMMNYGALLLDPAYLRALYARCAEHDVPTAVDEIQSGIWAPELFLYRDYGLQPTFVVIGKGFPGGEYPASRLIFSAAIDNLPQFGALVTNGQEELASLAYLITMRWAAENAEVTRRIGDYYFTRLQELAARFPEQISAVTGLRHLAGLAFTDLTRARAFVTYLTERGLDVSIQTYKADCPPVMLTKLPLIACERVVDAVVEMMTQGLEHILLDHVGGTAST